MFDSYFDITRGYHPIFSPYKSLKGTSEADTKGLLESKATRKNFRSSSSEAFSMTSVIRLKKVTIYVYNVSMAHI